MSQLTSRSQDKHSMKWSTIKQNMLDSTRRQVKRKYKGCNKSTCCRYKSDGTNQIEIK